MKRTFIYHGISWIKLHPIKSGIWFIILVFLIPLSLTFIFKENSGVIGDTFGGMTAPFINLLAAILVYISFNEQRKANKQQWNALKKESLRSDNQNSFEFLYAFFNQEIKNYQFPKERNLEECFNVINNPLTNIDENRKFIFCKKSVDSLNIYMTVTIFYLSEIIYSNFDETKKSALANVYLAHFSLHDSFIKIPDYGTEQREFLNKSFLPLVQQFNCWQSLIEKIKRISESSLKEIRILDLLNS